jgi:hypothetical protein
MPLEFAQNVVMDTMPPSQFQSTIGGGNSIVDKETIYCMPCGNYKWINFLKQDNGHGLAWPEGATATLNFTRPRHSSTGLPPALPESWTTLPINFAQQIGTERLGRKKNIHINCAESGVEIANAMFDTNRAFVGGALGTAIYSSNRYFDIRQSTFHANVGQGRGGAIYLNGPASGVTLRDVTFYQNTANNGGALSLSEGAGVRMVNVQGFENVANKGSGGFLFAKLASNMALQHVYLYNQTSIGGKGGGAIAVYQSKILLDNVTIEKCNAFAPGTVVKGERRSLGGDAANGGAVLLDEGADGEIFNSMFDSNSANDGSGGHVHSNAASLVVHDIVSFFSVPFLVHQL